MPFLRSTQQKIIFTRHLALFWRNIFTHTEIWSHFPAFAWELWNSWPNRRISEKVQQFEHEIWVIHHQWPPFYIASTIALFDTFYPNLEILGDELSFRTVVTHSSLLKLLTVTCVISFQSWPPIHLAVLAVNQTRIVLEWNIHIILPRNRT